MLNEILNGISNIIWGTPTVILLLGLGVFFTSKSNFFQIKGIKTVFKDTLCSFKNTDKERGVSRFGAFTVTLAACVGTGNISGVAVAITTGGPGAVFWMWVSAIFGMMTAYVENALSRLYINKENNGKLVGGAMYFLQNGLKNKRFIKCLAKPLAILFSYFCILSSFGIGNLTQINTIMNVCEKSIFPAFNIKLSSGICGLIFSLLIGFIIFGGTKKITAITGILVPIMAIFYMGGCLAVIIKNISLLPTALFSIIKSAFGYDAVLGGFCGITFKKAVSLGVRRGIFSNEAGLGSSPLANSTVENLTPKQQGEMAIIAVFIDTIVICTLTALVILVGGCVDINTGISSNGLSGANLVSAAFKNNFGDYAGGFIAISTLMFAFSSIIGWSFYGIKSAEYLYGNKAIFAYKIIYSSVSFLGAILNMATIWTLSDIFNGLMMTVNLTGIILLMPEILNINIFNKLEK